MGVSHIVRECILGERVYSRKVAHRCLKGGEFWEEGYIICLKGVYSGRDG